MSSSPALSDKADPKGPTPISAAEKAQVVRTLKDLHKSVAPNLEQLKSADLVQQNLATN